MRCHIATARIQRTRLIISIRGVRRIPVMRTTAMEIGNGFAIGWIIMRLISPTTTTMWEFGSGRDPCLAGMEQGITGISCGGKWPVWQTRNGRMMRNRGMGSDFR
jgi:hypothetical protein